MLRGLRRADACLLTPSCNDSAIGRGVEQKKKPCSSSTNSECNKWFMPPNYTFNLIVIRGGAVFAPLCAFCIIGFKGLCVFVL